MEFVNHGAGHRNVFKNSLFLTYFMSRLLPTELRQYRIHSTNKGLYGYCQGTE